MLKQNEKKNQYQENSNNNRMRSVEELNKREIQILNCIKGQSRTEKANSQNDRA